MVEDAGGFYEASRCTLLAMQKIMQEP